MPFGIEKVCSDSLRKVLEGYDAKLPMLYWRLDHELFINKNAETASLQAKIERIHAKRQAVIDELAVRSVTGEPPDVHHTAFFIDFVNGNDSSDGLTPSTAWKTIAKYTTTTVRAAGDVAYVRRGQIHSYSSNIIFDESGLHSNPIMLMGDDGAGWPAETGLPRTVIDFGSSSARFDLESDDYWSFRDLDVKGSSGSYGNFRVSGYGNHFKGILFRECTSGSYGVAFLYSGNCTVFEDCQWTGNAGNAVRVGYNSHGRAWLSGCSFDGNNVCVYCDANSFVELVDCDFGVSTANNSWDLIVGCGVIVNGRNVRFNDVNKVNMPVTSKDAAVRMEDYGGVKLANRQWLWNGVVERDTSVLRSGGADSSARIEPNDKCSTRNPVKMFDFALWAPAVQKTYSIYIRGSGWTTFPTANELWVEAYYYNGSSAKRAVAKSTQVLGANDVWTQFSVTVTPNSAGPLYLRGWFAKYQNGAKVYADVKPVVS